MTPYFIGLAGYSGSGKSTAAECLRHIGGVATLSIDHFYKDESECPRENGVVHWDLPESLHLDRLYAALMELKSGKDVIIPTYDKSTNRAVGAWLLRVQPVVLVEGMMLFTDPRIRDLMDLRLWMDVPKAVALERKWQREPERFNRTYYDTYALPATERFVDPTRSYAHFCIDGRRDVHEIAGAVQEAMETMFGSS